MDNLARKYTIEEYEELKENTDSRLEFWHGLIVDMGSPGKIHGKIGARMIGDFERYFRDKPCDMSYDFEVRYSKTLAVVPDLMVYCDKSKTDANRHYGAPDLVVEIWSPGNDKNKRDEKVILYTSSGVKEIWLVDPASRTTLIGTWNPNLGYHEPTIFGFNNVWKSKLFEGLETSLEGLDFDWENSGY